MNNEKYSELLQIEYDRIYNELSLIARTVDGDWVANMPLHDDAEEDDTIEADRMELFDINSAKVKVLESQIHDIEDAQERISRGAFGLCEVCNKSIEEDRLDKNPTARTCKNHLS